MNKIRPHSAKFLPKKRINLNHRIMASEGTFSEDENLNNSSAAVKKFSKRKLYSATFNRKFNNEFGSFKSGIKSFVESINSNNALNCEKDLRKKV